MTQSTADLIRRLEEQVENAYAFAEKRAAFGRPREIFRILYWWIVDSDPLLKENKEWRDAILHFENRTFEDMESGVWKRTDWDRVTIL